MNLQYRNRALVAKMTDTIDEMSGGRFRLCLGGFGGNAPELGVWLSQRPPVRESRGGAGGRQHPVTRGLDRFQWRALELRDCELRPRGPRGGSIPIVVAAHGSRVLRLTAQYADEWNTAAAGYGRSVPEDADAAWEALDTACRDIGCAPESLTRAAAVGVIAPDSPPPRMD